MRVRLAYQSTILFLLFVGARFLVADTLYFDILNQEIESPNLEIISGDIAWGENAKFDLDSDGQMDALLRHGYEGQPFGLSRSATNLLRNAERGLRQSNAAVQQIRDTLLQAANDPNSDSLVQWQQQIDSHVELMRRISRDTSYGGSILFRHAPGRYAFTSTPETLQVIGASSETQIGVYDFTVSTAAERANITADTAQRTALASDETLFLNDIQIDLQEGMSQPIVLNAINSLADKTGVRANTIDGATRVYTNDFGTTSSIRVISNHPAHSDTTGFGNTATADVGVDVVLISGSQFYSGAGNRVQLSHGPAKGLTFRVPPDGANPLNSLTGDLGQIEVIDNPFDPRVMILADPPRIQATQLLDGTAGLWLAASNDAVHPIRAAATTEANSYAIEVLTAGERAHVTASIAQAARLTADETLIINGVAIELPIGSTQAQVIELVNDSALITGVFADNGPGGATRFYSDRFGSTGSVSVVSNLPATDRSTGVGTFAWFDRGVDVEAVVNSNVYTGDGTVVRPTGGSEKGLIFSIAHDATDPVRTHTGHLGTIELRERPLSFPVGHDETIDVLLPDVRPRVYELEKVSVLRQSDLNDGFAIVNDAIAGLSTELGKIEAMLGAIPLAAGVAEIGSDSGTQFISEDGYIVKLNENDIVGPESIFDESGIIDASGLYPNSWDVGEGYLGFAVPDEGDFRFGWMRIEVGENASMIVKDFAIENSTGVPIWIGAPLPNLPLLGDFDSDGIVSFSDFLQFSKVFGSNVRQTGNQNPDFDGSGTVDFADFLQFSRVFQSKRVAAVPEPQGIAIALLASVCACMLRAKFIQTCRRRRN